MSTKISFPCRRFLAALLSVCCLCVSACDRSPKPAAKTRGYILISIDTLRADRLGAYAYDKPTSPFIDSLAKRSAVFEQAFVHLPGTLPSHMSIFTGLYPEEHGVFPPTGVLSKQIPTLPEKFKVAGFSTAGHTEGGYVDGDYGFSRGFDEFSDAARKLETDIEDTFARGLSFLEQLEEEEPFFLFLHTYSVHDPYFPSDEYLSRFWQGPKPDGFLPTGPNLVAYNYGLLEMSDQDLAYFKAAYDASIRYMDDVLRSFFERLEILGLADDVTVVLTSDHGEELHEHGKMIHSQLYPESLHVPLIVVHPEITEERRIKDLVRSIDIAPTLYDLAKIEFSELSGSSLKGLIWPELEPERSEEGGRRAFAVTAEKEHRTMIEQQNGKLRQLLVHEPSRQTWFEKEAFLDTFKAELSFSLLSHVEPRAVDIEVDGSHHSRVEIQPDAWSPVSLKFPDDGRMRRIRLAADDCVAPSREISSDRRCLSFRLLGDGVRSLELYDLSADPLAQEDISPHDVEDLKRLARRLRGFQPSPQAAAEGIELSSEQVERLKALGYLQ